MMARRVLASRLLPAVVAGLLVVAAPHAHGQPAARGGAGVRPTGGSIRATPAERRLLDDAFKGALAQPGVRSSVIAEIRKQLRTNRPVAFVDGAWVTPVRLRDVYAGSAARSVIAARTRGSIPTTRLNTLLAQETQLGVGFAFIPADFQDGMIGGMAADLAASLGGNALSGQATDAKFTDLVIVVVGALIDALIDYFMGGDDADAADPAPAPDDPDADPDGDGTPNRLDADDDGDGTNDDEDGHPYDPSATICMCLGLAGVSFVEHGGAGMMKAVLDARTAALRAPSSGARVNVGAVAMRGLTTRAQSVNVSVNFAGGTP